MPRPPKKSTAQKTPRQNRREMRRDSTTGHGRVDADLPVVAPTRRAFKDVNPLTEAQALYDDAIRLEQVIFGVGPAGTGKTWFAAMRAAEAFERKEITKIVITRPAVQADEDLGFLPGELDEKYEPYIRPLRDAFEEKFGSGFFEYLLKKEIIEARPLGLLRGSTLKNCWVLADEMQNASKSQMKMLLSRIGENSKFIINGDPKQSDLPAGKSGLMDAVRRLRDVNKIKTVTFEVSDIVRSGICRDIVAAYENE